MFSTCSCSGSRRTVLWFSEKMALSLFRSYPILSLFRLIHLSSGPWTNISRIITKGVEGSGVHTIVTRQASIKQMTQTSLEGFWRRKASLHLLMFRWRYLLHVCLREVKNSFFPSNTLIYDISRDGSKNFNIRTCEHVILGQLRIWAHTTTYAALPGGCIPAQ